MTTTSSVPIQGFGKLRISQPPGLEFGQDEPQTTAAMRSREAYVRPEPNTRAIGIQPQSINAKGPEKAWKLGGATTIGVRPSYEKTITSNVTVNYASPVNYQSPDCIRSRATSTASNLPIQSSAFQPAQLDSSLRSIPKEPVGLESSRHATKANSSAPPIRNQPGLRQSSYASDSPAGFQSRKASFSDTTRHTTQQATGPQNTMKPSTPRRSSDRHIPEPSLKPESQSLTKVTQAQSHIPEAKPRLSGLAASRFSTEQTASPQPTMGPSTTPKPSSRYTPNPPFKPEPPLAPKVVWTQAQGSEVKPKSSGLSASRFSTEQANSPQPTMIPSTTQKPSSRYTPDPPLPPEPRVVPKVGRTQALASEAKPKSSGLSASRFATNPSSESTMDPTVSSSKKGSKAIRAGLRFFEGV